MARNPTNKLADYFSSSREKGHEGLPLMSVTLNDGLILRESLDRKTDANLDPNEHLIVKPGYIAYNMMRVWQGALGRASADGLVSPAYVVLKPNEEIDSLYAEYLFKTARMIYLFWAFSYGLTRDRLRLYYNDFARIPVVLPPLPEQKKIAQILSTWDKAIATTEQLLANSQQQKKALMQQLLTGKKRLLDENGVRFSGEWETKKVQDFFEVGSSKRVLQADWQHSGVPFYRTRELVSLNNQESFRSEIFISQQLYHELATTYGIPKKGDFLVSGVGTLGIFYQVVDDNELYFKDGNVIWFRKKEKVCSEYFGFLFQSGYVQNQIVAQAAITTVATYTIKNAKVTKLFCTTSVSEQAEIVKVLKSAEAPIEAYRQKLNYLQSEKKALMQQLLTGKRRVDLEYSE